MSCSYGKIQLLELLNTEKKTKFIVPLKGGEPDKTLEINVNSLKYFKLIL